ncbi:hypothetical protein ACP70R_028339 [Stipagrostis hirtigluma subsp. patula]
MWLDGDDGAERAHGQGRRSGGRLTAEAVRDVGRRGDRRRAVQLLKGGCVTNGQGRASKG